MKYLIILTLLFFIGCTKQSQIPDCIQESGTAYAMVTGISQPFIGSHATVECMK